MNPVIKIKHKLQKIKEQIEKKNSSQGLILMYHRIAEEDIDPWSLRVTPQHFAEHLEILRQHTQPVSLKQLSQAHKEGNIPDRAVAITFDDGYANNLYQAKPILEKYEIPATVFVTTDYLEQPREFWWDELERVLLQPGQLPQQLSLTIAGKQHQWELGEASNYSESEAWKNRDCQAWKSQPGSRLHFYYCVWQQLQPLSPEQRQPLLAEIKAWANHQSSASRLTHRPLTIAELPQIEAGGIIELGAHTISHPLLSEQSIAVQQQEITQSKIALEKFLDRPVHSFAYPFGAYRAETVPLVREAGFDCACSTVETTVWRKSDRWQLPRFEVQNWDKAEFERRLLSWLNQ